MSLRGAWRLPRPVEIHYLRPPDRRTIYRQTLVHEDGRVKVTLARDLPFDPPLGIGGRVALERGSDAVWFTFPGAWHDIGRFHRADGTFTGIYANVITPCAFGPGGVWETTDLFVDLWIPAVEGGGEEEDPERARLLDLDELARAESAGAVSASRARMARDEGDRLLAAVRAGRWPPDVVHRWTRERLLSTGRGVGGPAGTPRGTRSWGPQAPGPSRGSGDSTNRAEQRRSRST